MNKEKLFLNTLTFNYPEKPIALYFSLDNSKNRHCRKIKFPSLIPSEVKRHDKFSTLFSGAGITIPLYTTFDQHEDDFESVNVDFNEPSNEYLVKRYYNEKLRRHLEHFDNLVITNSGITNDIQVWVLDTSKETSVTYHNTRYKIRNIDRFSLKIRYDQVNQTPYLLVALDSPAHLLDAPLEELFTELSDDPFNPIPGITPSMINKVMTQRKIQKEEGNFRIERRIDRYTFLHKKDLYCPLDSTMPIMSDGLNKYFGIEKNAEGRSYESKYINYYNKIELFRSKYLDTDAIRNIFPCLAKEFTHVNPDQISHIPSSKRMLVFGKKHNGDYAKDNRQQRGVNYGPRIKCKFPEVKLIFIFHESTHAMARSLCTYMVKQPYKNEGKKLNHYLGTAVSFAASDFHIIFNNPKDPLPEIKAALRRECYHNPKDSTKYVGIYISPIQKSSISQEEKECYYKIKEAFMKLNIPTQCIEQQKLNEIINKDQLLNQSYFAYTLQNMGVAICAKLEGSPWLLDEEPLQELIIGIGAFKSNNHQYIGAAFAFDNTGAFNSYNFFQKQELDELVGEIRLSILRYNKNYGDLKRIIIHYYKKMSRKNEFRKIEEMLHSLNLDVPVYVVSINKTESEDIVVFDKNSTYTQKTDIQKESLMPYSGTWVDLGQSGDRHTYLLCNNTRYDNDRFSVMDGFPFPVKLNIVCPNREGMIDKEIIQQLITQVYQFSRIYWKSVKQQALPVTIKYPEMIAEIMPHFESPTVFADSKCLWFL